jgi:hypothetical protein
MSRDIMARDITSVGQNERGTKHPEGKTWEGTKHLEDQTCRQNVQRDKRSRDRTSFLLIFNMQYILITSITILY